MKPTADFIGLAGVDNNFASDTSFVGMVRCRLGYAFGNLLIFATCGFAYGSIDDRILLFSDRKLANGNYADAANSLRTGVSHGGGAEYAILTTSLLNVFKTSTLTVKFKFIRYDLCAEKVTPIISGGNGTPFTIQVQSGEDLVRAGLSYKIDFNPPAGAGRRSLMATSVQEGEGSPMLRIAAVPCYASLLVSAEFVTSLAVSAS